MSTDVRNADKSNRFLDIYLDADTGKIYEFYVRTGQQWDDIDTDAMIDRYAEYLELTGLEKMRIKIRCWRRHRICQVYFPGGGGRQYHGDHRLL